MSTNRRKRRYERRPGLETLKPCQERQLLTGWPFLPFNRMDLDTFTAAWEAHGERLMREYVAEHPGRRPFAWWLLEHRQERPIISTWATPEHIAAIREDQRHGDKFNFLHSSIYGGKDFSPLQEEEEDYLRRNGLLTAAEERALARK